MKAEMFNYHAWLSCTGGKDIMSAVEGILVESEFTLINFVEHHFHPIGYTCLWLLGESHAAIHTFPEEERVYIEVSSCVEKYLAQFKEKFEVHFKQDLISI
jgi:S-adenosylmethionine decarboxylase